MLPIQWRANGKINNELSKQLFLIIPILFLFIDKYNKNNQINNNNINKDTSTVGRWGSND